MATVSRCGMLWFQADTVPVAVMVNRCSHMLQGLSIDDLLPMTSPEQNITGNYSLGDSSQARETHTRTLKTYLDYVCLQLTTESGVIHKAISYYETEIHGGHAFGEGTYSITACLYSVISLLREGARALLEHEASMTTARRLRTSAVQSYGAKYILFSLFWGLGGPLSQDGRDALAIFLARAARPGDVDFPSSPGDDERESKVLVDYFVSMKIDVSGWTSWSKLVPKIEINTDILASSQMLIPTSDTLRHTEVVKALLGANVPFILCGPRGRARP